MFIAIQNAGLIYSENPTFFTIDLKLKIIDIIIQVLKKKSKFTGFVFISLKFSIACKYILNVHEKKD